MQKQKLIDVITVVIEDNVAVTTELKQIAEKIVERLEELRVYSSITDAPNKFVTSVDKETSELPFQAMITTPMFKGYCKLVTANNKYWYINNDKQIVISPGSLQQTWKKLKKYGASAVN